VGWKGKGYETNASRLHDRKLVEEIGNFAPREAALEAVGLRD
jgi:hypothetical protein